MILPKIDKEFKILIQPLSDEEFSGLKTSVEKEGFRDPFTVWGSENILIDGHHRFKIGKEAKWAEGYEFNIFELEFENRNEAKIWIIDNQRSRRNLPEWADFKLLQIKAEILREMGKVKRKKTEGRPKKLLSDNDNSLQEPKHNTQKQIADELGWSTGKTAQAEIVLKEAEKDPELDKKLLHGDTTIHKEYQEIRKQKKAKKKKEKRETAVKILKKTKVKEELNIIHGDFSEMKKFSKIDLILTDPPYLISSEKKFSKQKGKVGSADFGEWDKQGLTFYPKLFKLSVSQLKPGGSLIVFIDRLQVTDIVREAEKQGLKLRNTLYWIKPNPSPHGRENLQSGVEVAIWFFKPGKTPTLTEQNPNWFNHPTASGNEREDHPTQKPLALFEKLICLFSNPGETVVDPFAGVGTTAVAAIKHKRNWAIIEKEKEYVKLAKQRIVMELS